MREYPERPDCAIEEEVNSNSPAALAVVVQSSAPQTIKKPKDGDFPAVSN